MIFYGIAIVLASIACASADPPAATEPRIVNLYSFCRCTDFRMPDPENFLFQATAEQIKLVHAKHLVGTWALQYDTLMNPRYQKLMKEQLSKDDEVGAWWEMPRPLIEKAGIKWRGTNQWDPSCRVDYSCAYTPEERIRIADVYMNDFKAVFGYYPATVGGWYIDEITLAHLSGKYGIVASCNCQDRVRSTGEGVGYTTLWGTYWNQAYYPSRLNAYMPAQTKDQQIDVPVFRMLGSDPIYQYARVPAVYAMEAAYASSGGSTKWVDWYIRSMVDQPSLGFSYAQVGQENSFGWDLMKQGYTYQITKLAEQAQAGKIRVETLKKSGQWFKSQYKITPPTAVVCLDDWRYQGRKSVWYDSRYYRVNLLWEKNGLLLRDLHRFDQSKVSVWHDSPLESASVTCLTLPIVEGTLWATNGDDACAVPVRLTPEGQFSQLEIDGKPTVSQPDASHLKIIQPLKGGGSFTVTCSESSFECSASDSSHRPISWAWELHGGAMQSKSITAISQGQIDFSYDRFTYSLKLQAGSITKSSEGIVRLQSADDGRLVLQLSD